jgi:hypothetical protein
MTTFLSPTSILIGAWLVILLAFDLTVILRNRRRRMRKW